MEYYIEAQGYITQPRRKLVCYLPLGHVVGGQEDYFVYFTPYTIVYWAVISCTMRRVQFWGTIPVHFMYININKVSCIAATTDGSAPIYIENKWDFHSRLIARAQMLEVNHEHHRTVWMGEWEERGELPAQYFWLLVGWFGLIGG